MRRFAAGIFTEMAKNWPKFAARASFTQPRRSRPKSSFPTPKFWKKFLLMPFYLSRRIVRRWRALCSCAAALRDHQAAAAAVALLLRAHHCNRFHNHSSLSFRMTIWTTCREMSTFRTRWGGLLGRDFVDNLSFWFVLFFSVLSISIIFLLTSFWVQVFEFNFFKCSMV